VSDRRSAQRTLSRAGTALVTLVSGLAVAAGPGTTGAAPPSAPVALEQVAASAAPGRYSPKPSVLHNNPAGTREQQYRLFRHINRSIRSAPRGSHIRFAVFSFADMRTADNLIAAHRRGVHVKLVFNGHAMYKAERKLRRVLGTNRKRRSYTVFCRGTCRAGPGEMHAKVFQFSRAGRSRYVTMVGSNNMTSHNAERQWSDLVTMVGWDHVYHQTWRWFQQLTKDRARASRIVGHTRRNLLLLLPQKVVRHGDPVLRALAPVYCKVPDPARGPGGWRPTKVRISMHAWYGPRGRRIANRVAQMRRSGCVVKVFHGEAFGTEIRRTLRQSRVRIATTRRPGTKTHQKLLVVQGRYGSNLSASFAWTGSHNWTRHALGIDDAILRVSKPAFVRRYANVFDWMFAHA
jgi:hypothetical protein